MTTRTASQSPYPKHMWSTSKLKSKFHNSENQTFRIRTHKKRIIVPSSFSNLQIPFPHASDPRAIRLRSSQFTVKIPLSPTDQWAHFPPFTTSLSFSLIVFFFFNLSPYVYFLRWFWCLKNTNAFKNILIFIPFPLLNEKQYRFNRIYFTPATTVFHTNLYTLHIPLSPFLYLYLYP